MKNLLLILIVLLATAECGTHGSLAEYNFPIKKDSLQSLVNTVLTTSPNVYRGKCRDYTLMTKPDGSIDTSWSYYYMDTIKYETINIEFQNNTYEYVFRYYGNETHWDTSLTSEISISYAFDSNGKGGHEGDFTFSNSLEEKLVETFESEFINKIRLQMKKQSYN